MSDELIHALRTVPQRSTGHISNIQPTLATQSLHPNRIEDRFQESKPLLSTIEATTEANRCIHCYDAPCIQACPTGINIPQFIKRIGSEDIRGAAKTILDSNILGLSCAHACPTEVLCEGSCVYNHLDEKPIMIGRLQRFAVETSYKNGDQHYTPGLPTGKKIALVGAGPASLACAHELRKHGHETVIYEKSDLAGGLNSSGIAPYKMKTETSLIEIEKMTQIGIEFKYNQELGRNVDLLQLLDDHDAVFLGMGLGPDHTLSLKSEDSTRPHVEGAVEFISRLKLTPASEMTWIFKVRTVVVIGGGNTALDAAREMKQLGIERVIVCYRRGEQDMSGYLHERQHARQEGVEFLFHTSPEAALKLNPQLVLTAIGQSRQESLLGHIPELKFVHGRLEVNPHTGETGHPKIFAGGDLANGGMEVVNAVAEGKRAAHAIHGRL